MDNWLSIAKVAEILGCDHSLIHYKMKNDNFPLPDKRCGINYFKRDEIEEYAKNYPLRKDKRRKAAK